MVDRFEANASADLRSSASGSVPTRERVRQIISANGPVTAAEIGEELGLTPAAMRRHLDALIGDGLIAEREAPTHGAKRRGRPARAFVTSEAGHDALPAGYDTLASQALTHLARVGGEAAIHGVARERAAEIAKTVAPALRDAGDDPTARAEALAGALSAQGFAATARPVATGTPLAGVQLCQGHCPVQHVARDHPEFCEAETEMFSELLGVHVQRLASLAHGDHVCTTFIPTITTAPAANASPETHPQDSHLKDTALDKKEQR